MSRIVVPAEVYSRVSGYFRPLSQWNKGKRVEFDQRKGLLFSSDMCKNIESDHPDFAEISKSE